MTDHELLKTVEDTSLSLLIGEPFYGHIIAGINKKVSPPKKQKEVTQIHSLGATTITVNFDSEKWLKLNKKERQQRLKKEVMHYIFMHPWADRPKDLGFFYTACNLSANKYTEDNTSFRDLNFKELKSRYKVVFENDSWETFYKGITTLSEYVFASVSQEEAIAFQMMAMAGNFWKGDQLTEAIFFLPKGPKGNMNLSEVSDMVKGMQQPGGGATDEEIKDAIEQLAAEGSDPWESVAKGTSDLSVRELIKSALKDSKMRGDVPGGLSSYIDAFLSPPKIDWRHELRKFTSLMGDVVAKTTMSKRSKRYGTFPATKIKRTQRVAVIADTSGSVSDEEFTAFFGEMGGILQDNCEIIFVQADADVDQIDIYKTRMPSDLRINRCGGGGTAFGPALRFVKTQGKDNDKFPNIGKVDGVNVLALYNRNIIL